MSGVVHVRILPPRLANLIDFEALQDYAGVDASSLRRAFATFVQALRDYAMPSQPKATLAFLWETLGLLIEEQALAAFLAEIRRNHPSVSFPPLSNGRRQRLSQTSAPPANIHPL